MIGLALTGIFADKYGQRRTIIGALALIVSIWRRLIEGQPADCDLDMLYIYYFLFS